jgi:SAM-dependent methyltransferase
MVESKPWIWAGFDDPSWRTVADEFLPVALRWKQERRRRVLDLGCGPGRHALFLARQGFEVAALDLAEDGLAELRRRAVEEGLRVDARHGDMLQLPWADASFDCLIAFHVVYHADLDGLRCVLGEIRRVLAPGGEAFLTLNSRESDAYLDPAWTRIDEYTLLKTEGPEVGVPHTYIRYEDLGALLAAFDVLKVQLVCHYGHGRKHAHYFVRARVPGSPAAGERVPIEPPSCT